MPANFVSSGGPTMFEANNKSEGRNGYVAAATTPEVSYQNGMRLLSIRNEGGVRTIFADNPPEQITDPALLQSGVRAQRRLFGTPGECESLYSTFKVQKSGFFSVGRVFQILWSEPAGETSSVITTFEPTDALRTGVFTGMHGERVYSKVRRFVIVRDSVRYSTAVPILTYGHMGVGKRGVNKSEHAIIYTGSRPPLPQPEELPARGEQPMRSQAIRVVTDNPTDKLDPLSRINLGKVHTIEHNLRVRSVGMVHPHYLQALVTCFANVVLGPTLGTESEISSMPRPQEKRRSPPAMSPNQPRRGRDATDDTVPRSEGTSQTIFDLEETESDYDAD